MPGRARRLLSRLCRRPARRARGAASLWLALAAASPALAIPPGCVGGIEDAMYDKATDRYPHGALGDPYEYAALTVFFHLTLPCRAVRASQHVTLPPELVFEDVKRPRLADLDGDGEPEILTVESHRDKGARVVVWARVGTSVVRVASTPFIGTRFRWLALIGAADLDGDGKIEIAYIDRPHLAKTLRIWRFDKGRLAPVAEAAGLTNHRFGEAAISGGIRDCGAGPEIVTANAEWSRVIAARLQGGRIASRDLGPYAGAQNLADALACR